MATVLPIGRLTEPVDFLSTSPPAIPVTTLTALGTVASAVTGTPHGLTSGDYAAVRGALPLGYNTTSGQVTVTSATQFSYTVPAGLASPATGTITVTFKSDSQGGGTEGPFAAGSAFAYIEPLNASERQAVGGAPAAVVLYRVVVHYRPDLGPKMKVRWLRYQETVPRPLEVHGVFPHPEPAYAHRFLVLECGEGPIS